MKAKNLTLIIFLASIVVSPMFSFAQQRRVDWIHGLGGDATSWQNVANNYGGIRQIVGGNRAGYNTADGIPDFAAEVQGNTGGANTISISHSLGGTAVRQVDIWNQNHWSGNMTVGSPLRGAQIAVSTQNGVAQEFIDRGITELLRGPAIGSTALFIISPAVGILLSVTATLGTLFSNTIADALVDAITDDLNLTALTVNSLDPNGNYMQTIAGQGTSTPKIQVWGREDNPILWRTAGTFTGNTDQWGVDLANNVAGIYHTAADIEYIASWTPPFIIFHGYWTWRGDQWMAGADWLRQTSNSGWQAVIGAGFEQHQNVWVPIYDYTCMEQNMQCDPENPNSCDQNECLNYELWDIVTFVVDQSDGVVPAFSARNDGGAWRGHIVEAPGTNHSEMLRFNDISPTFNPIFDGVNTNGMQIFQIGF